MAHAFVGTFLDNFGKTELNEFFGKYFRLDEVSYKIGKTKQGEPYFVAKITKQGKEFNSYKFNQFCFNSEHLPTPLFEEFDDMQKAWIKFVDSKNKDNDINGIPYPKAVENYYYATSQLTQTTMRNIVGSVTLDELLAGREKISTKICEVIDEATDPWGIKVENIELKDISLPEEMQRVIAKVAEAEREKTAVITKAAGEVEASENLAIAARKMSETPGALHLRTLATLNDLSSDQSNTIIFAIPIEIMKSFETYNNSHKDKKD